MSQQSVISHDAVTQGREPVDDFEQFAIDELGAEIVEVADDLRRYEADFCWLAGRSGEITAPPPSPVPLYQQPSNYLQHLLTIPQLPAPSVAGLLPAVAASTRTESQPYQRPDVATFEEWLETDLGKEVHRRIMENRHSVSLELSASYFDTIEDVQQKALIWLWQRWQDDPGYKGLANGATSLSHAAGCITKIAMLNARCKYAKRKREGREKQTDLFADDGYELPVATLLDADTIRATDIYDHDRLAIGSDKKADVQNAIERVTQKMVSYHSIAEGNHRRVPIEHITSTVIEGHMYHYTDRYNQTGNFRQFCEARGVSKNQISRWRPQIFDYLRQELAAYAPV
jgi:hypothetical protein